MRSLREIARCIGVGGEFRVVRDFFGYKQTPGEISLLTQMRRLQGLHIHLNFIRVGFERFTDEEMRDIDAALKLTRDVYATVDLGVGRIEWRTISVDRARGRDDLESNDEAKDLTNEWSVDNDGIDVFLVRTYDNPTEDGEESGVSPVDGPCDKNANTRMTGCVVEVEDSFTVDWTLAHELGHYLGLDHVGIPPALPAGATPNLMWRIAYGGAGLTSGQGRTMRRHCSVRQAC